MIRTASLLCLLVLLACGPDEAARRVLSEQLLTEAALCNSPTVEDLLKKGADIETRGWQIDGKPHKPDFDTPLLKAAMGGCEETVDLLLRRGADLEASTAWGTALVLAARAGSAATVRVLLEADADPDAKDDEGWTALMFASNGGHLEVMSALIASGAHVNLRNYKGLTALDLSGYSPPNMGSVPVPSFAKIEHQPQAAAVLLEHGARGRFSGGS